MNTGGVSSIKLGRGTLKNEDFSIAKIKFLWKAYKFNGGHGPLTPSFTQPMITSALILHMGPSEEKLA